MPAAGQAEAAGIGAAILGDPARSTAPPAQAKTTEAKRTQAKTWRVGEKRGGRGLSLERVILSW